MREFVELAFAEVGRTIEWRARALTKGNGCQRRARRCRIDPRYFRPTEVDLLLGDATKAQPSSAGATKRLPELVAEMVAADLEIGETRQTSGRMTAQQATASAAVIDLAGKRV